MHPTLIPRTSRKPKACAQCSEVFQPQRPMQKVCSPKCALEQVHAKAIAENAKKQAKRQRERKIALKPRTKWLAEAQAAFNGYVRARDKGSLCISCGAAEQARFTGGHFDAGHYRSTGAAPHLRFNTFNCHAQCKRCNRDLSGNAVEYRAGLIRRIGADRVEAIERNQDIRSFDIVYLRRVKKIFNKRARHIARLRGD